MITLGDIAAWIILNRSRTSFKDLTYQELIGTLSERAEDERLLTILGEADNILGIVCFIPDYSKKELYITDILTKEKGVVRRMMEVCCEKFPNFTLKGKHRSNRIRHFKDIKKLTRRL